MESRLEQQVKEWKEREQRFSSLFSASTLNSRDFLRQKLAHFEMLRAKFLNTQHPGDREVLQALRIEQKQVERKLYPNLFVRLLRRIVINADIKLRASKMDKQDIDHKDQLRAELRKAGLGGYSEQVIARMKFEGAEFSLPVAWNMPGRDRMDLHVQFIRDQEGNFRYQGYQAVLVPETGKRQLFRVEAGSGMHVSQAYNMLSGRAVYTDGTWCQLDMNDKDALGNCKVRHFPPGFQFDLRDAVSKLPLRNPGDIDGIMRSLENGDRVAAVLTMQGKKQDHFLEADPQWSRIAILNTALEKIDLRKEKAGNVVAMKVKQDEVPGEEKKPKRSLKI